MEFQYFGGNCISITMKKSTLVIDDNLNELGLKTVTKSENVALFTQLPNNAPESRLKITDPGEYEVSDVSIFGIRSRSHMDEVSAQSATIYKIQFDDLRVAIIGHIHPDLSEDQLEEIGIVDLLIIPVGGNGYTLDAVGAMQVIKKIGPKIVIPTHYEDSKINYPVPQQPLSEALKVFSVDASDPIAKFKPKPIDFSDNMQVIVLERQ